MNLHLTNNTDSKQNPARGLKNVNNIRNQHINNRQHGNSERWKIERLRFQKCGQLQKKTHKQVQWMKGKW